MNWKIIEKSIKKRLTGESRFVKIIKLSVLIRKRTGKAAIIVKPMKLYKSRIYDFPVRILSVSFKGWTEG